MLFGLSSIPGFIQGFFSHSLEALLIEEKADYSDLGVISY